MSSKAAPKTVRSARRPAPESGTAAAAVKNRAGSVGKKAGGVKQAGRVRKEVVAGKQAGRLAIPDRRVVEQFLFHEARLLDERRFEDWRDLFTEDGVYWMPTRHDQTSTDEVVSVFFDDRGVMASRIRRLRHPDAHIQVPVSRTAHLVGNVEVERAPDADGNIVVHAVFLMTEYRRDNPRWLSGRYRYLLARSGSQWRIRMKKVTLINCDAPLPAMAVYA